MVGKRPRPWVEGMNGANGTTHSKGRPSYHGFASNTDVGVDNARPRPRLFQFKDVANAVLEDQRREQMKKKLIAGVPRGELERFRKHKTELKEIKNKKVRQFYEQQNERLNDWLEVDTLVKSMAEKIMDSFHPDRDEDGIAEREGALQDVGGDIEAFLPEDEREARRKSERNSRWAININVLANVLLLAAKVGAVFFSSSLSLVASLVDSALDLLCTLIIWTTNKLVQWRLHSLKKRFPVGRRRLEPLGILVFSIIMILSFAQILQESVERLLPTGSRALVSLPNVAIFSMASTIVVKGIIGLGCVRLKSTQVQALAQDCKTDVYFNTLSLLFPLVGRKAGVWWLDPVGAAVLSLYVIYDWGRTSFDNVTRLSGSAVDDRLMKKLIYLAYRFSPIVDGFKNIMAYHTGDGVWVEVDVLLDGQTDLVSAHDIAETLQYCMEGLSDVDRAFVTIDYTSVGPTGHASNSG